MGRGAFEVRGDLREHSFLGGGGLERQNALQRLAHFIIAHFHGDAALLRFAVAAQRQRQLVVEKLVEDQPRLRRTAKAVQEIEPFFLRREVRVDQRLAPGGESVAAANFVRQRVGHITIEVLECGVDDSPQYPRADFADGFVHRHDAAYFRRVGGGLVAAADQFDIRIHHLAAAGTVGVRLYLSVQNEPLALFQFPLQVGAMKETRIKHSGSITQSDMKDRSSAREPGSCITHGAPARGYFRQDGMHLARSKFRDGRETNTIFVTEREIAQQIAHRGNAALFEHGRAPRPDSVQMFHRIA